jgi:hypothetical protein
MTTTREVALLQEIHEGPSEEFWTRYWELADRRDDEVLTEEEHQELLRMSGETEEITVRRRVRISDKEG